MQNDIKPALVVGLLLVSVVAVVFFRKSPTVDGDSLPPIGVEEKTLAAQPQPQLETAPPRSSEVISRPWSNRSQPAQFTRSTPPRPVEKNRHPANNLREGSSTVNEQAASPLMASSRRTYVVRDDDTLIGIARRVYGDGNAYGEIFRANRDQLSSPSGIRPGMRLRLPR